MITTIFGIFIGWDSIWEHPNHKFEFLISRFNIYFGFLKPLFSIALDLESLRIDSMHPMRFKAKEWSNSGFLAALTI